MNDDVWLTASDGMLAARIQHLEEIERDGFHVLRASMHTRADSAATRAQARARIQWAHTQAEHLRQLLMKRHQPSEEEEASE